MEVRVGNIFAHFFVFSSSDAVTRFFSFPILPFLMKNLKNNKLYIVKTAKLYLFFKTCFLSKPVFFLDFNGGFPHQDKIHTCICQLKNYSVTIAGFTHRKILRFGSRFKSRDYLPALTHKENFTITKKKICSMGENRELCMPKID